MVVHMNVMLACLVLELMLFRVDVYLLCRFLFLAADE
jgi:hypothetical protein